MSTNNGTAITPLRQLVTEFLAFAGDNWKATIAKHLIDAWVEELSDIPLPLLQRALKRARRLQFQPNIGDVRGIVIELAEAQQVQPITDTRRLLDRGAKPEDWEPLSEEARAELFAKFKSKTEQLAKTKAIPKAWNLAEWEQRVDELRKQARELRQEKGEEPAS